MVYTSVSQRSEKILNFPQNNLVVHVKKYGFNGPRLESSEELLNYYVYCYLAHLELIITNNKYILRKIGYCYCLV